MKILNVIAYFHPHEGGAETVCLNLSREMVARGHQVTVMTSNISSSVIPDIKENTTMLEGIKIIRLNSVVLPGRLPYMIGLGNKIVEYNDFDIVNVHTPYPSIAREIIKVHDKLKVPIVVTHHCDYVRSGFFSPYAHLLNIIYIRRLCEISKRIYVSTMQYANTSKAVRGFEDKYSLFSGSPSNDFLSENDSVKEEYILCVSRLYWYKGINYLLRAYKKLLELSAMPPLWIVGRGPEEKRISYLINKENLSKHVKLFGYVSPNEMASLFGNSYFLVLPSFTRREAYGMVLIESLARGKPIISSHIPGVSEVVERTGGGITAKARNPDDLAINMLLLLRDNTLRKEMGRRGKEYVAKYLGVQYMADLFIADLEKVLLEASA
jgi:rhamnosyl/mannosyltransferase